MKEGIPTKPILRVPPLEDRTFALGFGGNVDLWCLACEGGEPDEVVFQVINGCWWGKLKDGRVTMFGKGDYPQYPMELLWEGFVPKAHLGEAQEWIQRQVDAS